MVQPYAPAAQLREAYKPVIASLAKSLHCQVDFRVAASVKELLAAARGGHVTIAEFAGLGSGFAVNGPKPSVVEPVATYQSPFEGTPAAFNSTIYRDGWIGANHLYELTKATVLLSAPGSLIGDYLPRMAISQAKATARVRFVYAGSHLQALRDLACPPKNVKVSPKLRARLGPCTPFHMAALDSRLLDPEAKAGNWEPGNFLRLWSSEPIPYTLIGVPRQVSDAARNDLRAALLSIPAGNVRYIARLIGFAPMEAPGKGLVPIQTADFCPTPESDLCGAINELKLGLSAVHPLTGEGF
jgi:phosphonate transport system substrate-binding protein